MSPSERRRFRRPREISNIPLGSPPEAGRNLDRTRRRRGMVEGGPRTKIVVQRRRRAVWQSIALVVVLLALLAVAAWVWTGGRTLVVQSQLGRGLAGDKALAAATRERMPEHGQFAIAVAVTRGGKLDSAGMLGVDPEARRAWLQSVPAQTAVPMQGSVVRLSESYATKGPVAVVNALESILSTDVVGYLEIDADHASSIASGWTTPSAESSLPARERAIVLPVIRTLSETQDSYGLLALGRSAAGALRTNLGISDLTRLARSLGGIPVASMRSVEVPAAEQNGVAVPDVVAARAQRRDLAAGKVQVAEGAKHVEPGAVKVTVRNGIGVTGVGADAARRLKAAGFKIGEVGNTAQFVYPETLVIYKDDVAVAERVAKELPVGRVVQGRGMYAFDSPVLVIIGKDWTTAQ